MIMRIKLTENVSQSQNSRSVIYKGNKPRIIVKAPAGWIYNTWQQC